MVGKSKPSLSTSTVKMKNKTRSTSVLKKRTSSSTSFLVLFLASSFLFFSSSFLFFSSSFLFFSTSSIVSIVEVSGRRRKRPRPSELARIKSGFRMPSDKNREMNPHTLLKKMYARSFWQLLPAGSPKPMPKNSAAKNKKLCVVATTHL